MPGLDQRLELAVGDPVGLGQRQPVVEDRLRRAGRRREHDGSHCEPSAAGSLQTRSGLVGQPLADPGAAARPAEDGAALVGVAGDRRPVQVDHQVRDRARRQQRLVAAGVRSTRRFAHASRRVSSASTAVTSTSVKSRVLCPTHDERDQSAVLPVTSIAPGRLDVPHPQPGRGAEVRRVHLVLGEAEQLAAGRPRVEEHLAEGRGELAEDADRGLGRRLGPALPGRGTCSGVISGRASSAGRAGAGRLLGGADQRLDLRRARRCCATRRRSPVPSLPPTVAMTVSLRPRITPLVVRVFAAQRRLASLDSSATTTQPSRRGELERPLDDVLRGHAGGRGAHRPASAWVLRIRTPRKSVDGTAVAHRRHLPRLALAAVERAAEHVGLRPADGLHRPPEVGGRRLVGDVAQLAGQPAVLDLEEPLPGELEVVALHVDRPALVADDVDAAVDPRDELLGRRAVGGRLQRHVGHPLHRHVPGRVGERAAVGAAEVLQPRHRPVQLVADQHAVLDDVPLLPGHALVVPADGGQAVLRRPVTGDVHDAASRTAACPAGRRSRTRCPRSWPRSPAPGPARSRARSTRGS